MGSLNINEEAAERSLELLNISKKLVLASTTGLTKDKLLPILYELDSKIRQFISDASGEEKTRLEEVADRFELLIKRLEEAAALLPVDPEKVREFYKILTGPPVEGIKCLECGETFRTLRVHLRKTHGLMPAEYRKKHKLDPNTPLVCEALRAKV